MPSFHTPSSRTLWVATLCLMVAFAGFAIAATPKLSAKKAVVPKEASEQLKGTFNFPKKTYTVGEAAKGKFTLHNAGPKLKINLDYTQAKGQDIVSTFKGILLGAGKRTTLKVGEAAQQPGELTIRVIVTKPDNKTFKKVFTHNVKVKAKKGQPAPTQNGIQSPSASAGDQTTATEVALKTGCPLSVETVRRMCNLPSTMAIEQDMFGCLFRVPQSILGGTAFNYSVGPARTIPEIKASIGLSAKTEEISYLGEYAVAERHRSNSDEQKCGRSDFGHTLYVLAKGHLVKLRSDGAEIGDLQLGKTGGCSSYTSLGGGCSLDELKAIVKDVVIPYLEK